MNEKEAGVGPFKTNLQYTNQLSAKSETIWNAFFRFMFVEAIFNELLPSTFPIVVLILLHVKRKQTTLWAHIL